MISALARWLRRLPHVEPPAWALGLLLLAPALLALSGSAPPWPGRVFWGTGLVCVPVALAVHRRLADRPAGSRKRLGGLAAVGALILVVGYLWTFSHFTLEAPTTGEVLLKGFSCTPEARLVFGEPCPGEAREALSWAEYESSVIWEQWSIDVVRVGLVLGWLGTFLLAAVGVGSLGPGSFRALIEKAPPPYAGQETYHFVSYAHGDLGRILPYLRELERGGRRIWYDRGIPGATQWDETLSGRLRRCVGVIAFLSPASVQSKWVRREIVFADELDKSILCVRLQPCTLSPPLDLILARNQILEGDPRGVLAHLDEGDPDAPLAPSG